MEIVEIVLESWDIYIQLETWSVRQYNTQAITLPRYQPSQSILYNTSPTNFNNLNNAQRLASWISCLALPAENSRRRKKRVKKEMEAAGFEPRSPGMAG